LVGGHTPETAMKLTPKQAADRAVVSLSLVYQWCQDGVLVHYRLGRPGKRGCIRIDETDLTEFLATCRKEGDSPAPLRLKHIKLR
jgi:excisionase family DNA binding protein